MIMKPQEATTYRAIRVDDTADWKMVIHISRYGMSAYLKNEEDPTEPLVTMFNETWRVEEEDLLAKIQGTVYEHPQLFEDFSTEIIINTERALWIPKVTLDDRDEYEQYNLVYKGDEDDVFVDEAGDKLCVYSLVAGLNAFIRRTLPGARVWCQQTLAERRFVDQLSDMPRVYVDIRDGEADYYGFDGRKLLFATTHGWRDKMDIVYQVFNILELRGLEKNNVQVMISGKRDLKSELMLTLRAHLKYVMMTMLPSSVSKSELPLAVGLAFARR